MALGWVTDWHDYEIRAVTKSGVPGISPGYMHESTPISTVLRKSVRFFIINIFKIWKMVWTNLFFSKFQALDRPWDFQLENHLSLSSLCYTVINALTLNSSHAIAITFLKPRKWDIRELKSNKFLGGPCSRTPLEACAFGARSIGNQSVYCSEG